MSTKFRELAGSAPITPYIVYQAAKQGDCVALKIFETVGYWLGIALANLTNALNPERIIVGGGVGQAGDILLTPIREIINKRALSLPANAVKVVPAELGESAGVIGASLLNSYKG